MSKQLVKLIRIFLLSTVLLFTLEECSSVCNTKLIRHIFMLTCGRKKRLLEEPLSEEAITMLLRLVHTPKRPTPPAYNSPLVRAMMGIDDSPYIAATVEPPTTTKPLIVPLSGMSLAQSQWLLDNTYRYVADDNHDEEGEEDSEERAPDRREVNLLFEKCCNEQIKCKARDFLTACK